MSNIALPWMIIKSLSNASCNANHDHGLSEIDTTKRPVKTALWVTIQLMKSADTPDWSLPNVTFRVHLGTTYNDISRIYTVRVYE